MIVLDLLINHLQETAQDTRSLIFMDDAYTIGRVDGLEEAIEIIEKQKEELNNWAQGVSPNTLLFALL